MLQSSSQTPELAQFDVVIIEFEARVEAPVSRIVRVFGVDEPTAEALLAALPAMVCQAVNQTRAAHFARALLSIGARIEVRDQTGSLLDVSEWLEGVRNSGEMLAERTSVANDVAAPATATVVQGSDPYGDTLGATPTPAPQPPRMSRAEIEVMQHEPTAPRIAPKPAPGWGELQREPMRARAPSQPSAAMSEQLPSELLVPQAGPREFAAQDSQDRLSLEPVAHTAVRAASQPLTAAGQHPAMRGMSRPLSGQLSQPLTAAEFVGARPGARAPSVKLPKNAEPAAEQANDWSDVSLPDVEANAAVKDASGPSLGPPTTGQGPRLHTLDLSGPSLSLDPRAVRAVAARGGGVAYEAGPGRARKAGADDVTNARVTGDPAAARGAEAARAARGRAPSGALPGVGAARPAANGGEGRVADDSSAFRRSASKVARAGSTPDAAAARTDDSSAFRRSAGKVARAGSTPDAPNTARRASPDDGRSSAAQDDNDFWESFSDTLAFPFRGSGIIWLVSIGVWAICASALTVLARTAPIAGWTVMLFANSSVLALCADYHRRCTWAVTEHDSMLVQGPEFDPTHILQEYVRAGIHVAAFAALSQLPLLLWLAIAVGHDGQRLLDLTFSVHFWLLAALPSLYWPMAMITASLYNRCAAVWFLPVGMRAIVRAPWMYFAIVAAGALAFLVPWFVFAAVAREAGIPGSLMLAIAGFPMAASHGVMGALTGLLMRSKPNLFA